jgi:hypothetical protein
MWPSNALTERLNLKWPILQAPMGSASHSRTNCSSWSSVNARICPGTEASAGVLRSDPVHADMPHEVTVIKGRRFPTCRHCKGITFQLALRDRAL